MVITVRLLQMVFDISAFRTCCFFYRVFFFYRVVVSARVVSVPRVIVSLRDT